MNYRHIYHAGNFADVLKHIVLTMIVEYLKQKPSPFCYLDTHAGIGYYDLNSATAQKTKEYEEGVLKILNQADAPALLQPYLNLINELNTTETLTLYPGSPGIVQHFMRPQDRMVLCELHAEDVVTLKQTFAHDRQIGVHHANGYHGMKAFLPPPEKRGLALIDPAYERPQELEDVLASLTLACKHFANGIYALWYPLKEASGITAFMQKCRAQIKQPLLQVELSPYAGDSKLLYGSGMLIINPPWQLETQLQQVLPWLWHKMNYQEQGGFLCQMHNTR